MAYCKEIEGEAEQDCPGTVDNLVEMFKLHRFLKGKLSRSWNTRIVTQTKQVSESSDLKMYASSENRETVTTTVKGGMDCIGMRWNEKNVQ